MLQPYLHYKARVSGLSLVSACPSADSQKKTKSFTKTQKPLFTIFPSLKGNICTRERKKDVQNIILARITWKKSNETEAQDTLF